MAESKVQVFHSINKIELKVWDRVTRHVFLKLPVVPVWEIYRGKLSLIYLNAGDKKTFIAGGSAAL
jgi:hypothetical protein